MTVETETLKLFRNSPPVFARLAQRTTSSRWNIRFGQSSFLPFASPEAADRPLPDHFPLELCERAEDMQTCRHMNQVLPGVKIPLGRLTGPVAQDSWICSSSPPAARHSLAVDPWVSLVIPRTHFRANIPDTEGGFVLAYNLMMFAIVAVCLAAIHFAFDERQRKSVKRCVGNLVASVKRGWRGLWL